MVYGIHGMHGMVYMVYLSIHGRTSSEVGHLITSKRSSTSESEKVPLFH